MVKALRQIIRGNGKNREDGALTADIETLRSQQRKTDPSGGEVVQGYWSGKKNYNGSTGASNSAPLPESAPSIEEELKAGSLFAALDAYEAQQGGGY